MKHERGSPEGRGDGFMCPFCIGNGQIKVLGSNQLCFLAPADDPVLRNSLMVIPHRHVQTPFDLTTEEWAATREMLLEAKRLLDRDEPEGYSVGWNVHAAAGQTVPHAHLHVIGRYADEPLAGQGIRHALKQPSNTRPRRD